MGNYDDHPGKGFKEVRGYEPPAGTQAAAEKARRLEEERKRQQKNHDDWMKATSSGSQPSTGSGSCWVATA